MRHALPILGFALFLAYDASTLQAQAFVVWQPGVVGIDQSIVLPPQNSKLAGYNNKHVSDTDLAAMTMALRPAPRAMWVFGQCFGGGMFDELFGIPNVQAGMSASLYNESSIYPLAPAAGGNGYDFLWSMIAAMYSPNLQALRVFPKAATNDPWGPSPTTFPARLGEQRGRETPVYFSKGAGADALKIAPQSNALAILWAGLPESDAGRDQDQIASAIVALSALRYTGLQIFVLYGRGQLRAIPAAGKPANKVILAMKLANVPLDHLYAGTKTSLQTVYDFKFKNRAGDPDQLFFFAADHGINTAINNGAATPRQGPAGTADDEDPAGDPGSFAGQGDSGRPPAR